MAKTPRKRQEPVMIAEIMVGEYMHLVIDALKALKKPWPNLTEDVQNTIIDTARKNAEEQITEMVKLIAAAEYDSVVGFVDACNVKAKGIRVNVDVNSSDPQKHNLIDFTNKKLVLVLADPEDFLVTKDEYEPAAMPDQASIPD